MSESPNTPKVAQVNGQSRPCGVSSAAGARHPFSDRPLCLTVTRRDILEGGFGVTPSPRSLFHPSVNMKIPHVDSHTTSLVEDQFYYLRLLELIFIFIFMLFYVIFIIIFMLFYLFTFFFLFFFFVTENPRPRLALPTKVCILHFDTPAVNMFKLQIIINRKVHMILNWLCRTATSIYAAALTEAAMCCPWWRVSSPDNRHNLHMSLCFYAPKPVRSLS
jgi:hypothetical protein